MNKPIFRRMEARKSCQVSSTLAWGTNSALNAVKRVANAAGFPQRFTPYVFRRGVSNKLNGTRVIQTDF